MSKLIVLTRHDSMMGGEVVLVTYDFDVIRNWLAENYPSAELIGILAWKCRDTNKEGTIQWVELS